MASIKAIAAIALTLMIAAPIGLGYMMATEERTYEVWEASNSSNLSSVILNSSNPTYTSYIGTTNNTDLTNGSTKIVPRYVEIGDVVSAYPALTQTILAVDFVADQYVDFSAYDGVMFYNPTGSWSGKTSLEEIGSHSGLGPGVVSTSEYKYISIGGTRTVQVTAYKDEGKYADVSYGWKLPTTQINWSNNQTNSAVTFITYLPTDSTVWFGSIKIVNDSGTVTVQYINPIPGGDPAPVHTLGSYNYLMVNVTPGLTTIYGLTGWPTMGAYPTTFNKIEVDNKLTADFTSLGIRNDNLDAIFRVDAATILAGSYPTTLDYTLDMANLFPGKSYELKLNSIGLYGSSLSIAGETFEVTENYITVDGSQVKLKGITLSSRFNGTDYTAYIGNHEIGTTAGPSSITFGGEWSVTVNADLIDPVQHTRTQWAPGQFAFDKEDFAACGLLVAGACLVGLGMTGSRSGLKMGVLLLICGGAGLIYFTIL